MVTLAAGPNDDEVPDDPLVVAAVAPAPPDPTVNEMEDEGVSPLKIFITAPPPPPPPPPLDVPPLAAPPPPPITVTFILVTLAGMVNEKVPVPVFTIGVPELFVTVVGYTAVDIFENPYPEVDDTQVVPLLARMFPAVLGATT
jgi:hypothetical protein